MATGDATGNKLLDALEADDLEALRPHLTLVHADVRDVLHERGRPIDHVYFPVDLVASLISEMQDGRGVEVATVGNEGFVGLPVFLRAGSKAANTAFAQVPGRAFRMSSGDFCDAVATRDALVDLLQRYTQALFSLVAQTSACNRLHQLEERCARWLLLTHDRVGIDEFPLTQEFLAQMLGVQRTSVNVAAGALQARGVIDYTRGVVRVTDRGGLERASCECYAAIADEFRRLIPGARASA